MGILEGKDIETPAVKYAESLGLICFKLVNKLGRGFPDRTFIVPYGQVFFIEFKTPTGRLSGPQKRNIRVLRAAGVSVYVINSLKEAKIAIDKELKKISKSR